SVVVGQASTASVTVTDTATGTQSNPQGTLALSSSDTGDVYGTCTLVARGLNAATCSASMTTSKVGTSPDTITATFTTNDSLNAYRSGTSSSTLRNASISTTQS